MDAIIIAYFFKKMKRDDRSLAIHVAFIGINYENVAIIIV
jgi:hypothetical protein